MGAAQAQHGHKENSTVHDREECVEAAPGYVKRGSSGGLTRSQGHSRMRAHTVAHTHAHGKANKHTHTQPRVEDASLAAHTRSAMRWMCARATHQAGSRSGLAPRQPSWASCQTPFEGPVSNTGKWQEHTRGGQRGSNDPLAPPPHVSVRERNMSEPRTKK